MIDTYNVVANREKPESATELRRQLRQGLAWSRLNSDFLEQGELLPLVTVSQPPSSPAALVPFPVSAATLSAGKLPPELLAQAKIDWCYRRKRRAGKAILKQVTAQMAYYNPQPIEKTSYCWFVLDPQGCPYLPALGLVLPAIKAFAYADAEFPSPPQDGKGEAWRSSERDTYGADLCFSAAREKNKVTLTIALTRGQTVYRKGYRLAMERYIFFRQQLFFLLNMRLRPWFVAAELANPLRGTIYKKQ